MCSQWLKDALGIHSYFIIIESFPRFGDLKRTIRMLLLCKRETFFGVVWNFKFSYFWFCFGIASYDWLGNKFFFC